MSTSNDQGMIAFVPSKKERFNFLGNDYPSRVIWKAAEPITAGERKGTSYFYVTIGSVTIKTADEEFTFKSGWYGSFVGVAEISGDGECLICTRLDYEGFNQFGGPVERLGRLEYIDGCSSTLLLSAPKLGDPCFNYLHVPCNIDQTPHTHPTLRVGFILEGKGTVILKDSKLDLLPGMMFCLLPDVLHSFHTTDSELRIVIYHPDSDFGPSDEVHPMLNRTIIEGVSARYARRG